MTHTIEFDPNDNLVIGYAKGKTNIQDLLELINVTIAFAVKMNCTNLLAVLNEADLEITTLDFYSLPGAVAKIMENHGLNESYFRRALVGSKEQEILHFYETVTLNYGFHTKLFFDIEEAREWLREK